MVAIIGGGFISNIHAQCYKNLGIKIEAMADISEKVRQEFKKKYNCKTYSSAEEMLENVSDNIDLVDICAPTILHEEFILLALKYNKHVICEKPLSINLNSVDNIISKFFEQNPTEEEVYKKMHRESIESDIFIDAVKYFRKEQIDFEKTDEYKYIKLYILGRTDEAKEFYKNNNLNITEKRLTISKNDDREEIGKKFNINRMFCYKHKENLGELTNGEKEIFNRFLDSVKPNKEYEKLNEARKKEDIYLAGILDRVKTETIKSNTKNIKRYNELMERQGFDDRINYDISDNDDQR